ncbi:MAG: hypothetical protein JST51_11835 [Armatimonadetes bacterium]|nr:hypothetical protein [Armatimonadota bacterium]
MMLAILSAWTLLSQSATPTASAQVADDIDRAVALWKEAGMPIPPASALPAGQDDEFFYGIADPLKSSQYMHYFGGCAVPNGLRNYAWKTFSWDHIKSKATSLRFFDIFSESTRFRELGLTSFAVQAAALGHRDVTQALLEKGKLLDDSGYGWLGAPVDSSLSAQCAMAIYVHCANESLDPKIDRETVIKSLKTLAKYSLIAKAKSSLSISGKQGLEEFIRALELSSQPSKAPPGSVQAAVDDLVNAKLEWRNDGKIQFDAVCNRVKSFSMDAVPALTDLIGSQKLSRTFIFGLNMRPNQIVTLGPIVNELLLSIANGDLGENHSLTKEDVQKWAAARKTGSVEKMLMSSLFRKDADGTYCNGDTFDAIAQNHPELLKQAYLEVRKAGVDDWIALRAIESSKLSKKQKRDLLVLAAQGDGPDRLITTYILHKFDQNEYDALLLRHYAKIPKTFNKDYASISNFALGTENPKVWDLLEKKIAKADTPMKMALLSSLGSTGDEIRPIYPKLSIRLLRKYFDDTSTPKDWKSNDELRQFVQLHGGPPTVGQAALEAAAFASGILYVNVPDHISPAEWKSIRKRIEAGTLIPHPIK